VPFKEYLDLLEKAGLLELSNKNFRIGHFRRDRVQFYIGVRQERGTGREEAQIIFSGVRFSVTTPLHGRTKR